MAVAPAPVVVAAGVRRTHAMREARRRRRRAEARARDKSEVQMQEVAAEEAEQSDVSDRLSQIESSSELADEEQDKPDFRVVLTLEQVRQYLGQHGGGAAIDLLALPLPGETQAASEETISGDTGSAGLVRLAERLVHHAAELAAWDETRRHAVSQILAGRSGFSDEIVDVPASLVAKLLRPKGYSLPGSGEVQQLGSGSFGRVFKARRTSDGRLVAVKRQLLGDSAHDVVPVLREMSILNAVRDASNVVQIEDAFLACPTAYLSAASGGAEVWTVLEHFPQSLSRVGYRFRTEEYIRRLVFQVMLGLHSLHSADVVHRDLKPENILVDLGSQPPQTLRVAICDFGISRSVHGFADECPLEDTNEEEGLDVFEPFSRKLSDRVTSVWWRAPEMWGWADTGQMTKQDLKSLDVFSFGLVWAGLVARRGVINHKDGVDPPKFRLLEILRKVDQPSSSELDTLGFSTDVALFVRRVLTGDLDAVRSEMADSEFSENSAQRELLLGSSSMGIREWVYRHGRTTVLSTSRALDLMEDATRFSYKKRPPVEQLLADEYFDDLRDEHPGLRLWARREAPVLNDVAQALEIEHKRQFEAAQRARELRELSSDTDPDDSDNDDGSPRQPKKASADTITVNGNGANSADSSAASQAGDSFIQKMADNATATIEDSVRTVCDRVRAELDHTRQQGASPRPQLR